MKETFTVLYGTTNPAKLTAMRRALEGLNIDLLGLYDLQNPLPEVKETGRDVLENAELKARLYYKTFGLPVFSCDSGLYFDGLPSSLQPGTHVRRLNGKEMTDEEMLAHYSALARENGGKLVARYKNAVCFIADEDAVFRNADPPLWSAPFYLTSVPHPRRVEGFPLDALSVDPATGEYYYDLPTRTEEDLAVDLGFRAFFTNALRALEEK